MNGSLFPKKVQMFLRTPKGSLLVIFAALFGIGATAVGWPLAVPHMLAAVLGAVIFPCRHLRLRIAEHPIPGRRLLLVYSQPAKARSGTTASPARRRERAGPSQAGGRRA